MQGGGWCLVKDGNCATVRYDAYDLSLVLPWTHCDKETGEPVAHPIFLPPGSPLPTAPPPDAPNYPPKNKSYLLALVGLIVLIPLCVLLAAALTVLYRRHSRLAREQSNLRVSRDRAHVELQLIVHQVHRVHTQAGDLDAPDRRSGDPTLPPGPPSSSADHPNWAETEVAPFPTAEAERQYPLAEADRVVVHTAYTPSAQLASVVEPGAQPVVTPASANGCRRHLHSEPAASASQLAVSSLTAVAGVVTGAPPSCMGLWPRLPRCMVPPKETEPPTPVPATLANDPHMAAPWQSQNLPTVLWRREKEQLRDGANSKRAALPAAVLAPPAKKAYTASPYVVFCREQRPFLPTSLRNADRERTLGQMWKALSEAERASFKVGGDRAPTPVLAPLPSLTAALGPVLTVSAGLGATLVDCRSIHGKPERARAVLPVIAAPTTYATPTPVLATRPPAPAASPSAVTTQYQQCATSAHSEWGPRSASNGLMMMLSEADDDAIREMMLSEVLEQMPEEGQALGSLVGTPPKEAEGT